MRQTALITGASSGIGEAFAKELAKQGKDLVLVARSKDKLDVLADELSRRHGIEVLVIPVDLSQETAARQIYNEVDRLGKQVDLLVNNAGFGLSGEFLNHPAEDYRKQVALNVTALMEMTHLFLPGMVARRDGAILNIASLLAFFPFPYCSVYSATKAFVLSFTESLWEEYRSQGIRILAVCPGPTETNFFKTAREVETRSKRTPEQVVNTALGALGKGRSFVIDGTNNYFTALLGRIMPRRNVVKMFGSVLRKSIASKQADS